MRHFFIINPASGPKDVSIELSEQIKKVMEKKNEPYEIYVTKEYRDSYRIALLKSQNLTEETIFYACGGDGTSFDVINGIAGKEKAYFAVVPVGSCNDFLKTFKDYNFKILEDVINGELKDIDICKANEYYYLNELNIGYDALVNDDCNKSPIKAKNVKKAYNRAIIKNLIHFKSHQMKATVNDESFDIKALLVVIANGQYYGSKYRCAPFADTFDSLADFVIVDKISRLKFIGMIKGYEVGAHLTNKKYEKIVHYRKIDKVTLESNDQLVVCLDGEIFYYNKVEVEVIHNGIKMLFPKNKHE